MVFGRIRAWWRDRKRRPSSNADDGLLREFVYLDDVSVYSILASRKGSIAAEFSENQTLSLNSDMGATIDVGLDPTSANVSAGLHTGRVHGSQVVRKAIIQTSFKELYEIECKSLALLPPRNTQIPKIRSIAELEKGFERLLTDRWIVDPGEIRRGDLFEAEVELEADSIFRMMSIITTLREIVENNERIFGREVSEKLPEMRAIAQVLDGLLVGLVPIRGRLVKYAWTRIGDREVLIHELLVEHLVSQDGVTVYPAYVVGVAQANLFWKDIRRLLFSRSQYTVFCRLAVSGLGDSWNPIKIAGLLEGIIPQFADLIEEFSQNAEEAFAGAAASPINPIARDAEVHKELVAEYARQIAAHHDRTLDAGAIESVIGGRAIEARWWRSVDTRRAVFRRVTEQLDESLGFETSGEVAYRIRQVVMRDAGLSGIPDLHGARDKRLARSTPSENNDRFLDAEFIAIYW